MTHDQLLREERELHEAFRPLRPDREAFLAGVERRIAERGERAPERSSAPPATEDPATDGLAMNYMAEPGEDSVRSIAADVERSPFLRAAASLLPPGFLPSSVLVMAGKKLTWKAAPALLAMPAIALAMLVLTFAAALTQVKKLDSSTPSSPFLTQEEIRRWWWSHRYGAALTFVVLGFAFWFRPADALVGFLLASIGCLALILRRLSAAGFASRLAVGTKCGALLLSLGLYSGMFGAQSYDGILHAIPRSAGVVLIAGALVCLIAACNGHPWRALRKSGQRAAVVLIGLHLVPLVALSLWPLFVAPWRAGDLRSFVEAGDFSLITWPPSARAALWLREQDVEIDLSGLATYVEERRKTSVLLGEGRIAALQLGLLSSDELWDERQMSSWRRFEVPRGDKLQTFQLVGEPKIHLLAASGEMTDDERATLTRKALAAWPANDSWMPLHGVRGMVGVLDTLGTADAFEPAVPKLHALLMHLWGGTHSGRGGPAGFFPQQPYEFKASNASSTLDAVELMARFGVPDELDGRRVRAWLEGAAKRRFFWRKLPSPDQIRAATALDMMRERLPETGGDMWRVVVEERVLIGVLLLVMFCCVATLRAPRSELPGRPAKEERAG